MTQFHIDEFNYGRGGTVRFSIENWIRENREVFTGRNNKYTLMLVIFLNKLAKDLECQVIYRNEERDDMFSEDYVINRHFDEGLTLVLYLVYYSYRYHSSLRDDVEIKENGFSIRYSFYLTANIASLARYLRSLSKNEMGKIMNGILSGGATSKTATKN